jgi:lantibiotic transport system permease protein
MSLLLSLRSETLKLKRTLSVYLCIIGAGFGPLMSLNERFSEPVLQKHLPWTEHFLEGREPVSVALLPLYTILVCTLLVQIEYRDKTWKQVFTSPQRMGDIFLAKFISLQGMIVLFLVSYTAFLGITAFATEMIDPERYDGNFDSYKIWCMNAQVWILVLGISAIQFWLSLRFKNFIVPLAIGIAGWFMAAMMIFEFKTPVAEYYPYAFPLLNMMQGYKNHIVTHQWYSIATAVVFLLIAFAEFRRRKIRA